MLAERLEQKWTMTWAPDQVRWRKHILPYLKGQRMQLWNLHRMHGATRDEHQDAGTTKFYSSPSGPSGDSGGSGPEVGTGRSHNFVEEWSSSPPVELQSWEGGPALVAFLLLCPATTWPLMGVAGSAWQSREEELQLSSWRTEMNGK